MQMPDCARSGMAANHIRRRWKAIAMAMAMAMAMAIRDRPQAPAGPASRQALCATILACITVHE